jgi:hypothetical protein
VEHVRRQFVQINRFGAGVERSWAAWAATYPKLRRKHLTYSGSGYDDGYREGQKADIGGAKIRSRSAGTLGR